VQEVRNVRKALVFVGAIGWFSMLLGCGGGGGGGSGSGNGGESSQAVNLATDTSAEVSSKPECSQAQPMTAETELVWRETEQCTELAAPAPRIIYSPTVTCPRNGQPACLATVPFFSCSDDPSQTCGAVGRFLPECGAIELPDRNQGAAAHEMIHYLLRANGRQDWAQHGGPEWVCQ
jgi:hypothetical protein